MFSDGVRVAATPILSFWFFFYIIDEFQTAVDALSGVVGNDGLLDRAGDDNCGEWALGITLTPRLQFRYCVIPANDAAGTPRFSPEPRCWSARAASPTCSPKGCLQPAET